MADTAASSLEWLLVRLKMCMRYVQNLCDISACFELRHVPHCLVSQLSGLFGGLSQMRFIWCSGSLHAACMLCSSEGLFNQ